MNFSLYHLYTLSQLRYRQTKSITIDSQIVCPQSCVDLKNEAAKGRQGNARSGMKQQKLCQTISIPSRMIFNKNSINSRNMNARIWGLKSMTFTVENAMVQNLNGKAEGGKCVASNCEFALIINLPISTKQSTVAKQKPLKRHKISKSKRLNVPIHWNAIEVATFELPISVIEQEIKHEVKVVEKGQTNEMDETSEINEKDKMDEMHELDEIDELDELDELDEIDNKDETDGKDEQYVFKCDISEYRGLSFFNPNIYDLNAISFDIRFDCGENSHLSCTNVKMEIDYFVNTLIKRKDMQRDNGLWVYAVDTMNIALIEYLIKHKSSFDINCTHIENGNNALHICCMNKSVPLDIVEKLVIHGIDLNQQNGQGYTPLDLLHHLVVISSKMQDKELMTHLLLENGAKYHLVDPRMDMLRDNYFFQRFIYPHPYIGLITDDQMKLDMAMHKLAYELLFVALYDANNVNIFVIFDIMVPLSQIQRKQLCIKYHKHYKIDLFDSIYNFVNSPVFSQRDQSTVDAAKSISLILRRLCVPNEEYGAMSILLSLSDSNNDVKNDGQNKKKQNKISVERLASITRSICLKTNYEIRKLCNAFVEIDKKNKGKVNDGDDDIDIKLTSVLSEAIQDSLNIQQEMVGQVDSINSIYGREDRDKIVLMRVLINLLSLKRHEKVHDENVEFDIDAQNIHIVNDELMEFDPSKVPFDMLIKYARQNQHNDLLRDEFDEWFIFFTSQCSWEYIQQFDKYFSQAYLEYLTNGTTIHTNETYSFWAFALSQLKLPLLMQNLLFLTLAVSGCRHNIDTVDGNEDKFVDDHIYHSRHGKSVVKIIERDLGNEFVVEGKENEIEKVTRAGYVIVERSEIDICKLNQLYKWDNLLLEQKELNNEMQLTLKYLLLKLIGADMSILKTVLSKIDELKRKRVNTNDREYRIYLPKIEDVRQFSIAQNNPYSELEHSKSLQLAVFDEGGKYINYSSKKISSLTIERLKAKLKAFWNNHIGNNTCSASQWVTKLQQAKISLTLQEMGQLFKIICSTNATSHFIFCAQFVNFMVSSENNNKTVGKFENLILNRIDRGRVLVPQGTSIASIRVQDNLAQIMQIDKVESFVSHFSKNRITAKHLFNFNQNIDQFIQFGLVVHGFEHDCKNIIYETKTRMNSRVNDIVIASDKNKDENKDEHDDGKDDYKHDYKVDLKDEQTMHIQNDETNIRFGFSKYSELFYKQKIEDNATYDRYNNLILMPFLKEDFGNRLSKYKLYSNISDKRSMFSRFWDKKIDIKRNGEVDMVNWLSIFSSYHNNGPLSRDELTQIGNILEKDNSGVIVKDDFVNLMIDIHDDLEFEDLNDDDIIEMKITDETKILKSKFEKYIWKEARNPLNYRSKSICRLLFNVLTVEGIPYYMINNKSDIYCLSCSIDSNNLELGEQISDIALSLEKNANDVNKKILFGYPILNKCVIFDSFNINDESINVSLSIGTISEQELIIQKMFQDTEVNKIRQKHLRRQQRQGFEARVVQLHPNISGTENLKNIVTRMMKRYYVVYDEKLINCNFRINVPEIIDSWNKEKNSKDKRVDLRSGKDFTIIHNSKVIIKKKEKQTAGGPEEKNDDEMNIVYCIQAQFLEEMDLLEKKEYDTNKEQVEAVSEKEVENVGTQGNSFMPFWGTKFTILSQKGNKKRILIEWNFVTSDDKLHKISLQHTQNDRVKTRKILWIDGVEKYNEQSGISSFEIDVDRNTVVIQVELSNGPQRYKYGFSIDDRTYDQALDDWKIKNDQKASLIPGGRVFV